MSVRSEKTDSTTAAMNQIDLSATAVRTDATPGGHVSATIAAAQQADSALSESNTLSVSNPDHPITRTVSVTIRSSLGDLCLRKAKGQWAPTQAALKSIFQKKKFTSLGGSAEGTGDLRSVVLHDLTMTHMSSSFPLPVGATITAVDSNNYSVTGDAFGYIAPANSSSTVSTKLQADDTSLAYEFARKVRSLRNLLHSRCFSRSLSAPPAFAHASAYDVFLRLVWATIFAASSGERVANLASRFLSHAESRFCCIPRSSSPSRHR